MLECVCGKFIAKPLTASGDVGWVAVFHSYYSATWDLSFVFVREAFTAICALVSGEEYNMKALKSGKLPIKGEEMLELLTLPTE